MKKTLFFLLMLLMSTLSWQSNAQGNTCDDPYVVTQMPFSHSGNTADYGNDYTSSDVPPLAPGAITNGSGSSYLGGDDVVYSYTAGTAGFLNVNASGVAGWTGMYVFTGCPFASTVGSHTSSSAGTRSIPNLPVVAGETYYIVISTWPTPNSTAYTLSLDGPDVAAPASCPKPAALAATAATTTTADVIWTEAGTATEWDVIYGAVGFDPLTQGNTVTATGSPGITLTGLTASSDYQFYVKAICGEGDESFLTGPAPFSTACEAVTVPYSLPFETGVNCVTVENAGTGNNWAIYQGDSNGFSGTFAGYSYHSTNAGNAWLYTAEISLNVGVNYQISYKYGGSSYTEKMKVAFGTTNSSTAMTNLLADHPSITGNTPNTNLVSFTVPTTGTYYFGFNAYSAADQNVLYLDDIEIFVAPTCIAPTAFTTTSVSSDTADVAWTAGASETEWNISWGAPGYTPGDGDLGTDISNTASYQVTGLSPQTNYDVYVQSNCGGGDLSAWTGPVSFTTLCTVVSDIYEDFESTAGTSLPNCWSKVGAIGTVDTRSSTKLSGARVLYVYNGVTVAMPAVDNASAGSHQMVMDVVGNFSSGATINFGYLTDASDASSFVSISSIVTNSATVSQEFATIPSGLPAGDVVFAIYAPGPTSTLIDNVRWEPLPSCPAPSALAVTDLTANTADVAWTPNGTEEAWNISWGAPGYVLGQEDLGTGTPVAESFQITGLTTNTQYEFYVQADCGNDQSAWSGPVSFTTLCSSTTLPYVLDFETATVPNLPSCTSRENLGTGNNWVTATYSSGGFTGKVLKYGWNGSNAANTWFYTQGIELMAGVDYQISYRYGNNSTSYSESMKVAYGTSPVATAMTNQLADYPAINQLGSTVEDLSFTVPADGVYYFGFHAYSAANLLNLYVDDISIITAPECTAPEMTLATQDANGGSIDCLETGGEYYVLATLSGGEGNSSYNVSANGGDAVEVTVEDGSVVLGPFTVGTNVSVTAVGAQDDACSVTASINSPVPCPPVNETCDGAIALDCNAGPITYSSVGSTATNTTSCSMGNNGIWFSFVGTGADITVNTSGSFDIEMSVNTGTCGELINLACRDQFGSTGTETYTIVASVANQMYYVYVAHYASGNTTTGDITISIDCAVVPDCTAPEMTLAAQDANGGSIDCLQAGGEYYVLATLSGGSGNTSYNISANSGDAVEVTADDSVVFGPFTVGTNVSVTAVGAQDDLCSVTASINSPAFCPPVNETCDEAIALDCNAGPITYSSVGSTAVAPAGCSIGANGIWFSFMGTGADITINSSANFDHKMSMQTGVCNDLTWIACKDSALSNGTETYTIEATIADQMYYVYVAHYSTFTNGTGSITISIECAVVPECIAPEMTLAVQDANGGSIDCLETGGEYFVLATLSGGEGNTSYNVSANSGDAVEVTADGSEVFGPFTVGTNVSITAVGAQDDACSVTTSINSPTVCPPVNEDCEGAIALDCNAGPVTYSSVGSTAIAPAGCTIGKNGIWFSFVGTGADITINSSASFDHKMSMQTGVCNDLTWIACKDSSTGAETYTIANSVVDQMYYVYVAHWSSSSTTTGSITMSIECAVVPECAAPEMTLAAQDANGGTIDCLEAGGEYYVLATLSGGSGNTSYNVSANGGDAVEVNADDSVVLGPFTVGTDVSVTAVGAQDDLCSVSASIDSPAFCPPVNDDCDSAIALDCNAGPVTYSSVGSTATNTTTCTMGSNGIWFSFVGTGADITVSSSASFDHEMSINSGSCGALVNIACRDSVGNGATETYTITASVLDQMYYVYVAHWSGSSSTTGDITISIDCAVVPECTSPEMTLAAQDANGGTIDCLETGGEYYVLATLSGGSGNTSYNVSANGGAVVEVNADDSVVLGPFTVGTDVDVLAVGVQDDVCSATASIDSPAACPPANNDCIDAIALSCGDSVTGTTVNATDSGIGSPSCSGGSMQDVFYTLDVQEGSEYTVTVVGADYDGVLVLYTGSCGGLTELDCADNGFSAGVEETITFTAAATETITIRTYDWSTSAGSFTISVSCGTIPVLPTDYFVTTWQTTSSNETITIPTTGPGYNYSVEWGDGNADGGHTGNASHTYATPGVHTVKVSGDFPRIFFNNSGDRLKIKSIEQWGTIEWSSMNSAFMGAENLVSNATDMPDLSMVTDMYGMFAYARAFNGDVNMGNWDVSNVTNMKGMFGGASVFNYPIGTWNVGNVTSMEQMFHGATLFNQNIGTWNVGSVTNMDNMFNATMKFNQNLDNWDVSSVTTMKSMFKSAVVFNGAIGSWNVSNVTNMYTMLAYARKFNQDIGNWNVSNVTNMHGMFGATSVFNQYIGNWDVGNVTDMSNMFYGSSVFNQDLGLWNVSNVTVMNNMFRSAIKFNQDIGNWNVSNVTTMIDMFNGAVRFNQDIGGWDVSNVSDMTRMFRNSKLSTANYDALLNGWSMLPLQSNVKFHGGNSKYCAGEAARLNMINNFNWTIVDGGKDCTDPLVGDRLDLNDNGSLFGVTLYPNPMADQLHLGNPKNVQLESVSIYDLTGRLVQHVDLRGMTSGTTLDVSKLSSATYMVLVSGKDGQKSELMIKE